LEDIKVLQNALPFMKRFKGATFVVKFGGEAMRDKHTLEALIEQVVLLHMVGIKVILVHGGGAAVTETARQLGIESRFVNGRRITDDRLIDVLKMVLPGKITLDILALLKKHGVRAMGVSGVAASVIHARKRPPREMRIEDGTTELVDFGQVGDIERIDTDLLTTLLDRGYLPVLSPLGADAEGNILNINADTVAGRVASELHAAKLILMTGTPGVLGRLDDPTTLISRLTADEARETISSGMVKGGMVAKLEEAIRTLGNGTSQVHILSALEPHQILIEVFTQSGCGTMLTP
jgi:acetylglutamate kinase